MAKPKKLQIINELIDSVLKFETDLLYEELMALDSERYSKVINSLTPGKFLELVQYDFVQEKYSGLWNIGNYSERQIKKELLDILPPDLLIHIAKKCSASISQSWGLWHSEIYGHKNHLSKGNNCYCSNLSGYFFVSSKERIAEIINFLINTCLNVKVAKLKEKDIFDYEEEKQFPFEVVHLFSSVHPKVFFPAINLISDEYFKKMFYLCRNFIFGEETFENIFQNQYGKEYSFDEDLFNCIVKYIGELEDKYFILFLREFNQKTLEFLIPQIGKKRIEQLHKNGFDIKHLPLPRKWNIFPDKKPNQIIIENIQKGKQSVRKLTAKKSVELLGSLL